ncbi:MAG: peptidylprolyl isomerase [Lachnospiraceae bacterium]|nr:peptidylprolyl isomerase [Lachnospiraceae bacterium]
MKHRLRLFICILIMTIVLPGCNTVVNWNSRSRTVLMCAGKSMNDIQMKIVAMEYKELYEFYYAELLSEDFWKEEVSEGIDFEQYVLHDSILPECQAVLYLNAAADQLNIKIPADTVSLLGEAAKSYYQSLSDDEKAFTGTGESDVLDLLILYQRAILAEKALISGHVIEVSDEASRVADIEVIHTSSVRAAEEILARYKDGENFYTLAQENTIDQKIKYSVSRADLNESFRTVIFSLQNGQVSEVVRYNEEGFIIRVANTYNTLLSLNNRRNLLASLRFDDWRKAASTLGISDDPSLSRAFFNSLSLTTAGDFRYHDLFSSLAVE